MIDKFKEAKHQARVRYIPSYARGDAKHLGCADGRISSVNDRFVFVRFDKAVGRLGWDGATSQACDPADLVLL